MTDTNKKPGSLRVLDYSRQRVRIKIHLIDLYLTLIFIQYSNNMIINKLHHLAMRCEDSETTRKFYEDFLGLPLVYSLNILNTQTGRSTNTLHTFYQLGDGSHLAFFEAPDMSFTFKNQHDFDLHTALEVSHSSFNTMIEKANSLGIETRGISDHGFIKSVYFRDPNGYVIELTAKMKNHDAELNPETNNARTILNEWTKLKKTI